MFNFLKTKPIAANSTYQQVHYGSGVAVIEKPETIKQPKLRRPKPLTKRPDPVPKFDEYLALAAELDVASASTGLVLQRAVADLLWEKDVEMFNYNDVRKYMSALAKKEDAIFCWRPLRERDIPKPRSENHQAGGWGWGEATQHDHFRPNLWGCRTYDKPVPFEILQNVKMLEDRFPGKLHFFVSDYTSNDPDPFIMVTARDMDRIIFGVWDEPAFFKEQK